MARTFYCQASRMTGKTSPGSCNSRTRARRANRRKPPIKPLSSLRWKISQARSASKGVRVLFHSFALIEFRRVITRLTSTILQEHITMIVAMQPGASEEQIKHICDRIREFGYAPHVIKGTERTVIAAVGPG